MTHTPETWTYDPEGNSFSALWGGENTLFLQLGGTRWIFPDDGKNARYRLWVDEKRRLLAKALELETLVRDYVSAEIPRHILDDHATHLLAEIEKGE